MFETAHRVPIARRAIATAAISAVSACASQAQPPPAHQTVVDTVKVDGQLLRPDHHRVTHALTFPDGTTVDLAYTNPAYHLSEAPELLSFAYNGRMLGADTPGYQAMQQVFSETTLRTLNRAICLRGPFNTCNDIKLSFSAIKTAQVQARTGGEDDLNCQLSIDPGPFSVRFECGPNFD